MDRKHGTVDFHITQMLSGHGCFGHYFKRFKKLEEPICVDCCEPFYDAEHVSFRCDRWWRECRALEVELKEEIDPDTLFGLMVKKRTNWEAASKFTCKQSGRKEKGRSKLQT